MPTSNTLLPALRAAAMMAERFARMWLTGRPRNIVEDIDRHDEYGWRNWGDTPARNEYDESGGPHHGRQAASHYNHEYDHGYGMLFHGLRTLDAVPELALRWWRIA